jgi:hypothetical protein
LVLAHFLLHKVLHDSAIKVLAILFAHRVIGLRIRQQRPWLLALARRRAIFCWTSIPLQLILLASRTLCISADTLTLTSAIVIAYTIIRRKAGLTPGSPRTSSPSRLCLFFNLFVTSLRGKGPHRMLVYYFDVRQGRCVFEPLELGVNQLRAQKFRLVGCCLINVCC